MKTSSKFEKSVEAILMLDPNGKWHGMAERASTEMNSEKLMALAEELCREMDEEDQASASLRFRPNSKDTARAFVLPSRP